MKNKRLLVALILATFSLSVYSKGKLENVASDSIFDTCWWLICFNKDKTESEINIPTGGPGCRPPCSDPPD